MATQISPVHIITIADDDDPSPDHQQNDDVTILSAAPKLLPSQSRKKRKINFIDLENDDVQILDSPPKNSTYFFDCDICADSKPYTSSFPIEGCTHTYCTHCIQNYVVSKLDNNITQIRCPNNPNCPGLLEPEYCRSILPPPLFERWGKALSESVILEEHKLYCPYKDCSGLILNDDGGENVRQSECPHCFRLFCAQCNVEWHDGIECSEFMSMSREDAMLVRLAKDKKWIRCPKCRFFVEKSSGCLFMQCRCGHRFCYNCGAPLVQHYCTACKR